MPERTAVYSAGMSHRNPVPAACRIGNLVVSGVVNGVDPATGGWPATLAEQCECLLKQVDLIVQAAGGTMGHIIKMTVWMHDVDQREALNAAWLQAFPDPHDRPARHTMPMPMQGGKLIQCDFMAVLDQPGPTPAEPSA